MHMQKYVLIGAGIVGERFYRLLKDDYNILCFADNAPEKQQQKYLSLDVIPLEDIPQNGLIPIITMARSRHISVAMQLYKIGVKEFYIPESKFSANLVFINLNQFEDFSVKKNKICVLRRGHTGALSASLVKHNPFSELEIEMISVTNLTSEYLYHYITCRLVISQHNEKICADKKTIELWHGFTIKSLGYMSKKKDMIDTDDSFSALFASKDVVCSISELYSIFLGYCYNIPPEKFHITGYPRNDMLFNPDARKHLNSMFGGIPQKHVIIYLPTHRQIMKESLLESTAAFLFDAPDFDINELDMFFEQNDILFISKMHSEHTGKISFDNAKNIKQLTDEMLDRHNLDLYEVLGGTDMLISDYSSVIIDYLLIDKPMVFMPLDIESYRQHTGLMTEPYPEWMPGEITFTCRQLKKAISNALFGEDFYKKDRQRLRKITHKFSDANSTRRVLALAKEIIKL